MSLSDFFVFCVGGVCVYLNLVIRFLLVFSWELSFMGDELYVKSYRFFTVHCSLVSAACLRKFLYLFVSVLYCVMFHRWHSGLCSDDVGCRMVYRGA